MRRPVFINLAVDRPSAACADRSGRAYRQIVYLVYPLNLAFEREGRGASDSLVRRCNLRRGVFHDYSHVFVL